MTIRQTLAAAAALALVLHLAGCDRPAQTPEQTLEHIPAETGATPSPGQQAAVDAPVTPATAPAPADFAVQPSPDHVLRDWGAAIERRDWAATRALWGHGGADSGVSAPVFAAQWGRLRRPRVTVGRGQQEGAAGSLFYTAPVTIIDGARRIAGELTLRRVNDVDGATAEQLRWHLDPAARAPWLAP